MREKIAPMGAWLLQKEALLVAVLGAMAFASIPLALGHIGLSWDALNHHIYLGWTAERHRFDQDYLAASYQSYQYPFLYWPVYKLAMSGASGTLAGVVLALLHALAIPPVWMLAKACIPGRSAFDFVMRLLAVVLAFTSALVLSLFDSTSNDLLAAIPMVWALAIAFWTLAGGQPAWLHPHRAAIGSGLLAGISVAFKLSSVPLFVLLPVLWGLNPGPARMRVTRVTLGLASAALGYLLAYGYWGWQLWTHFGNPLYPFLDGLFVPLRSWLGWHP